MSGSGGSTGATTILGANANEVLRVETSVTFNWVPDPGNSYSGTSTELSLDDWTYYTTADTGPSRAVGRVTFDGVSSSAPFSSGSPDLYFAFTDHNVVEQYDLNWTNQWVWNPATGSLDPHYSGGNWGDWVSTFFGPNSAEFDTANWFQGTSDTELGHWVLAPDPRNVEVFGGTGNDTIYGGQGQEMLSGGDGNDVIYAGRGDDTISGGNGNDTISGGSGTQLLEGGAGNDLLQAGNGNETLLGGAGDDVFAFGRSVAGHDVIADFQLGQDIVQVARNIHGLAISRPQDLLSHIAADPSGAAVLTLGSATVTLDGISAQGLIAHFHEAFRIA